MDRDAFVGKQRRWRLNQFGVGQKQSLTTLLNARMIFSVFLGKMSV